MAHSEEGLDACLVCQALIGLQNLMADGDKKFC